MGEFKIDDSHNETQSQLNQKTKTMTLSKEITKKNNVLVLVDPRDASLEFLRNSTHMNSNFLQAAQAQLQEKFRLHEELGHFNHLEQVKKQESPQNFYELEFCDHPQKAMNSLQLKEYDMLIFAFPLIDARNILNIIKMNQTLNSFQLKHANLFVSSNWEDNSRVTLSANKIGQQLSICFNLNGEQQDLQNYLMTQNISRSKARNFQRFARSRSVQITDLGQAGVKVDSGVNFVNYSQTGASIQFKDAKAFKHFIKQKNYIQMDYRSQSENKIRRIVCSIQWFDVKSLQLGLQFVAVL